MYALVDGNNFYASCERVFNPALNGKPVIVLSNNDGIVIARSNEAKSLGIKMGTPAFKVAGLIQKHNIAVFSSNYALYGDMSQRMMQIFKDFTPDIEIYSIDEAFLDFSGFDMSGLRATGKAIRKKVKKMIGIPVSVGIAPTKTLSKIANRIAKKHMKDGVALIDTPEKIEKALKITAIDDIWGVGRQYSRFLQQNKVQTAWDFTRLSDAFIRKNMSVTGLRIKQELLGTACIPMEYTPPARKNIRTARTFAKATSDYKFVSEAIANFAAACARKLRDQNSVANLLTVFIRTNKFAKNKVYYTNSFTTQLNASNSSIDLIQAARKALQVIYKEGFEYKKAGVLVSAIAPAQYRQLSLFDDADYTKHCRIMQVLDKINVETGKEIVKIAAQGQGRAWQLKQEQRSKRYTTRWDELMVINVDRN